MIINRKPDPIAGDIKTKRKFLIIPRITKEKIAWLGFYNLKYECVKVYCNPTPFLYWDLIDIEK